MMSFLRWAGSKRQLLDVLSCCWYAANAAATKPLRYVEGFSGSAALFFHVRPSSALLVDINEELQLCLAQVKQAPELVYDALCSLVGTREEYYRIRALDRESLTDPERAAVFIYLNRYCFNGLYRTNSSGKFNVPFGGARSGSLPTRQHLQHASVALRAAEIATGDFHEQIDRKVRKYDFVYLDPPYAKRNAGLDNQYGPDVFGYSDLRRLKALLGKIDSLGASFLVSYAECDESIELAEGWATHVVEVRRTIAANSDKRGFAKELLITNI